MKTNNLTKNLYTIKYSISEYFACNKFKIIICLICCLIGLLTGILTGIKIFKLDDSDVFESFNLIYEIDDLENFASNFFGRLFSYEFVAIILLVFALHPIMYIFGWCLLAYRTFLISLNCVMILLLFSFNGVIKGLLIIFPCQILIMLVLVAFFCFCTHQVKKYKYYKCKKYSKFLKPFLMASLIMTLINVIETLLLLIFRSNVILVI